MKVTTYKCDECGKVEDNMFARIPTGWTWTTHGATAATIHACSKSCAVRLNAKENDPEATHAASEEQLDEDN